MTQGHALNEKIALSHPLEPLPSEAETQNITTALDQLVQHFGLGDYHQGLVKQVKDAFADPSQDTNSLQFFLISKTSPLLTLTDKLLLS